MRSSQCLAVLHLLLHAFKMQTFAFHTTQAVATLLKALHHSILKFWRAGWDEVLHSEKSFSYCIFPSVPPRIADIFLLHYATQMFWI